MSLVKNPIKRIYINNNSSYSKVIIELELSNEIDLQHKPTKIITLESNTCWEDSEVNTLFDTLCDVFGIIIKKSNLQPVTFVNMFCSDKDAKISEFPQSLPKPTGVLL